MKIGEAQTWLRQRLETIYPLSESSIIALLAIEHLTGFDRSMQQLRRDEEMAEEAARGLPEITERLLRHEPVQYVTGRSWFYGMELFVDGAVLIPRPETEELVDWIVKDMMAAGKDVFVKNDTDADRTPELKILDIGTGSGCIALSLKKAMPLAEVWGCDVSEEALNVARRNGSANNIRVDFQGLNFLDEAQQKFLPSVDVIVSNPPYIPISDKASMHPNVLDWEPHTALFVPDTDALLFYRAIARFAHRRLHEGGRIYLEIHEGLATPVRELFHSEGHDNVEVRRDMQGKERMVRVIR